jgi:hypothetical protein
MFGGCNAILKEINFSEQSDLLRAHAAAATMAS